MSCGYGKERSIKIYANGELRTNGILKLLLQADCWHAELFDLSVTVSHTFMLSQAKLALWPKRDNRSVAAAIDMLQSFQSS